MTELWAIIDTRRSFPRILVTEAGREPILKARMTGHPQHAKALATFLEALSLWEGRPVRAALIVGERDGCDLSRYHDFFAAPDRTPMYSIDYIHPAGARRRDRIKGMGKFCDLKSLLVSEVAR